MTETARSPSLALCPRRGYALLVAPDGGEQGRWPLANVSAEVLLADPKAMASLIHGVPDLPAKLESVLLVVSPQIASSPQERDLPVAVSHRVGRRKLVVCDEASAVACAFSHPPGKTLVFSTASPSWLRVVDFQGEPAVRAIDPARLVAPAGVTGGRMEDLLAPLRAATLGPGGSYPEEARAAARQLAQILFSARGASDADELVITGPLVDLFGSRLGTLMEVTSSRVTFISELEGSFVRGLGIAAGLAQHRGERRGVSTVDAHGLTKIRLTTSHPVDYHVTTISVSPFVEEKSIDAVLEGEPALFLVDEGIGAAHLAEVERYCGAASRRRSAWFMLMPGGERCKTIEWAVRICEEAIKHNLPRRAVLVGVGGGAILDTVGFAASMYRRGIGYARIPTTLVGQIDVAVGIKHAVNLHKHKNIIGSFYAPRAAINYPGYLATLPVEEIRAGLAEMVKIALVRDAALYEILVGAPELAEERFASAVGQRALELASAAMMEELQPNLFEHSLERKPDFGHTFGPGLELPLAIRHGEAVAIDMAISTCIAARKGIVDDALRDRILLDMERLILPIWHPQIDVDTLIGSLDSVVAHRGGKLNLVVPDGIGRARFITERNEVTYSEVEAATKYLASRYARHARRALP